MKVWILSLLLWFSLPIYAQVGPSPFSSLNTWNVVQVYSTGQAVIRYGVIYQSLVSNNVANDPSGSASQWTTVLGSSASGLPYAPGSGYGPISTAAGTGSYTAQSVPISFDSYYNQYIQQEATNSNWTTLFVNTQNNTFYADGFAAGGAYSGVGHAQVAYDSSVNEPICQAVSYSGSNYVAVNVGNGAFLPGVNPIYWFGPVPNSGATTVYDCGFAVAATYATTQNVQTTLVSGNASGAYNTQGLVEPTGLYSVSLHGAGIFGSRLIYTGTAAMPMLYRAAGNNDTFLEVEDLDFNGNGVASATLDLTGLNQSELGRLQLHNIAPGGAFFVRTGLSGGDDFQLFAHDIVIGGEEDSEKGSNGTFAANLTAGGVTSFTVNSGGTNYPTASATAVYFVQLNGNQGGTAAQPCTVMPSNDEVVTVVSGAITAISAPSSPGSGCSGTIDVQVYTYFPVSNAWLNHASDSSFYDITLYAGGTPPTNNTTGWGFWNDGGNNVFVHMHPSFIPNGIWSQTDSDAWVGTELDNVFNIGMDNYHAFGDTASSITGTQAYGSGVGRIVYNEGANANVNFGASASLCGGAPPADWTEFMTPSGPIQTAAEYSRLPAGSVTGNDSSCGLAIGDYVPTANAATENVVNLNVSGTCTGCGTVAGTVLLNPGAAQTITQPGTDPLYLAPTVAAVSGTNQNGPIFYSQAYYWNGTASAADSCGWNDQAGSGTNPNMAYTLNCGGSSGTHSVFFGSYPVFASALATLSGGIVVAGSGSYVDGTWAEVVGASIAAAATIAPTAASPITHITGTAATVETITPPTGCHPYATTACEIKLISDAGFAMGLTGNIAAAKTTVTGEAYLLIYDPATSKWYPTD